MPSQARPKYAIVSEFDAPSAEMVCQWVEGVGYCYLDRKKKSFDGMTGRDNATDVRAFGFSWAENPDGTVSFYKNDQTPTATYTDGEPRRWQGKPADQNGFEGKVLNEKDVKKRTG